MTRKRPGVAVFVRNLRHPHVAKVKSKSKLGKVKSKSHTRGLTANGSRVALFTRCEPKDRKASGNARANIPGLTRLG